MTALLFIGGLLLMIYAYSRLWEKGTEGKIRYLIRLPDEIWTAGDEGEIWVVLENTSWFPLPWLELAQPLSDGLLARNEDGEWSDVLVFRSFLLPRQRVQRCVPVRFAARGLHRFESGELRYGDGIGLKDAYEKVHDMSSILVRPRLLPEADLHVRLDELIGERAVQRWYQEDASRLQGVRGYQLGDPYKAIHWAATARTGELMIKQFETTSQADFCVVINGQFFEPFWTGSIHALLEHEIRAAATWLQAAAEQGLSISLSTNAGWTGAGSLHIPPDDRPDHYETLLAALGGLSHRAAAPFEDLLGELRGRLRDRTTLVIFTAHWSPSAALAVEYLRAEGHTIRIFAYPRVADTLHGLPPGIPVTVLAVEEDEDGADRASLDQEVSA